MTSEELNRTIEFIIQQEVRVSVQLHELVVDIIEGKTARLGYAQVVKIFSHLRNLRITKMAKYLADTDGIDDDAITERAAKRVLAKLRTQNQRSRSRFIELRGGGRNASKALQL